ncbi:MAG: FtsW/RodA/SpoVE family cell cycle protein, partial [Oscillospiraceae bacterium]|nr:FtsW/RodA/SpoVE family cell cycle protein [Oscillospiraceae bacterium]
MQRTDRTLWLLCFALSCFSIVLILGILDSGYAQDLRISTRNVYVQGAAVLIGAGCAVITSLIDYKSLAKLWKLHVPLCYGLMIMTFFIGVGASARPGDRRWLLVPLANVSFQPSELLRISFILVFAYHIFMVREKINHPLYTASLAIHAAIPIILMYYQGDSGSALILAVIVVTMLFCSGINWAYLVGAGVLTGVSLPLFWYFVLNDFQRERMTAILNITDADTQGIFFQQYRAKIALAMGGEGGVGIFDAPHIYVPEMHNDFIFTFLGESTGFVGSLLTITVMVVIWFKIQLCASRAKDLLGGMICMGVFSMLAAQ